MSNVTIVIGVALALMIGGLIIAFLSSSAGRAKDFFWWVGIIIAVCGLFMVVARIAVFITGVLEQALGVH